MVLILYKGTLTRKAFLLIVITTYLVDKNRIQHIVLNNMEESDREGEEDDDLEMMGFSFETEYEETQSNKETISRADQHIEKLSGSSEEQRIENISSKVIQCAEVNKNSICSFFVSSKAKGRSE